MLRDVLGQKEIYPFVKYPFFPSYKPIYLDLKNNYDDKIFRKVNIPKRYFEIWA